jgi:replication initiation and membrane attachment protein
MKWKYIILNKNQKGGHLMRSVNYQVNKLNEIGSSEIRVISQLYTPIIGRKAFTVYMQLLNDAYFGNRAVTFNYEHLQKFLRLTLEQINVCRRKLEAVNLLSTLYDEDEKIYLLELNAPLSAYDFFQNTLLDNELLNRIGSDEYERIRFLFSDISYAAKENFTDVSASFCDVFEPDLNKRDLQRASTLSIANPHQNVIEQAVWDEVHNLLAKWDISFPDLNAASLQALQTAAFEFHLTPKELALVIKNTYNNETNSIKYADVKNFVTQVEPKQATSDQIRQKRYQQKVMEFEQNDAVTYAKGLLKVAILEPGLISVIHDIRSRFKLHDSVINVLLDYSYRKNEGKIVGAYIAKVAATLAEKNINHPEAAMEHLRMAFANTKAPNQFAKPQIKKPRRSYDHEVQWTDEDLQNELFQDIKLPDNIEDILKGIK